MAANRVGVVTEEEKQVLLERYLDIVWLDNVTEVKCVRCNRVPIHHYVSDCQHIFCRNCKNVFSDGGQWKCPSCRQYVTELSDQEWQLEDTIYQLTAHCPNKKYGCHFKGQLKTIPGHLKSCVETREAALPAEFKGITLDTVTNAILGLRETNGEMRSELRESKDKNESYWNELKERVNELSSDQQQIKERESRDVLEMQQLKSQLQQQQTLIEGLTQHLNEQKQQSVNLEQTMKVLIERELRDALEIEQLRSQLQQQTLMKPEVDNQLTNLNVTIEEMQRNFNDSKKQMDQFNMDLHEQEEQTESKFRDKEARDALEIEQLKSQLQQQQSLIETNTAQNSNRLTDVNVNMEKMQSAVKDVKDNCETKWTDVKRRMDEFSKDLHGQKQQLVDVRNKESIDSVEIQQLKFQVQKQQKQVSQ